jgi:hypothetical protein
MSHMILAVCLVYSAGLGAFTWSYIQNGVFLALDERPWWLATIQIILWPIMLPIDIVKAFRS